MFVKGLGDRMMMDKIPSWLIDGDRHEYAQRRKGRPRKHPRRYEQIRSHEARKKKRSTNQIGNSSIEPSIRQIRVPNKDKRKIGSSDGDDAHDGHLDCWITTSPDVDQSRAERAGKEGDGEQGG